MIKFSGRIVQFGFGGVGKSFYEKVAREIQFHENNYYVLSRYAGEFDAFINLGGMAANFITCDVTKENFRTIFGAYLRSGDLLLDFADTVGTRDICDWCASQNIMYLNTGDADWPEDWLNIFSQQKSIEDMQRTYRNHPSMNRHPIVLQHGNNPGLVSHFVKAGIAFIVRTQHKRDRVLRALVRENRFAEAACRLGLRMIHVNDIDLQKIRTTPTENAFFNTWCVDACLFELLSEATISIGSHERAAFPIPCKRVDPDRGFVEFETLAAEHKCRTYYPGGAFEGFLVPHEETLSIAKSLELRHNGALVYRPSVMFLYAPCHTARDYLMGAKANEYPTPDTAKPLDSVQENGQTVIRGYVYPQWSELVYREHITEGTEYVGVLLLGEHFDPVWVGNRVELSYLYRKERGCHWQTPTITPVAMSALAAACWMLKNKDKGGIYLPDQIDDYRAILKTAEKYISKTIYQTIPRETIQRALGVDLSSLQAGDFLVRE